MSRTRPAVVRSVIPARWIAGISLLFLSSIAARAAPCADSDGDRFCVCDASCSPVEAGCLGCGDCKDLDASIRPGALETCDAVDNNCDNRVDWVDVECRVGLGECSVTGVRGCAPGDALPACHLATGTPTVETCNLRDDDCDGLTDEEPSCAPSLVTVPPCDCTIGSGQPFATLCAAIGSGCVRICAVPGSYSTPSGSCSFPQGGSLVALGGHVMTTFVGSLGGVGLLQGFTVTGSVTGAPQGTLLDNRIQGSMTVRDGTAAFNQVSQGIVVQQGGVVWGNFVPAGGISAAGTIRPLRIVDNVIRDVNEGITIFNAEGPVTVQGNAISSCGLGIRSESLGVTGVLLTVSGNLIERCSSGIAARNVDSRATVVANVIHGFSGSGIEVTGPREMMAQAIGNEIAPGIGLPVGHSPGAGIVLQAGGWLSENTIVGAVEAVKLLGGTSAAVEPTLVDLESNIFVQSVGAGVHQFDKGFVLVRANDVFAGSPNWLGLPDPTGLDGNISLDPAFLDPVAGDFALRPDSPCVDKALPGSRLDDTAGGPRLVDGDMDTSPRQDLGAYEAAPVVVGVRVTPPPVSLAWDQNGNATAGYDIYRSVISESRSARALLLSPYACGVLSTARAIGEPVPSHDGYLYFVAPRAAARGSLGFDSNGQERLPLSFCP